MDLDEPELIQYAWVITNKSFVIVELAICIIILLYRLSNCKINVILQARKNISDPLCL